MIKFHYRGSGDGLTMELLTDQLVTNIMDEVTGRSVEVPEQQEPVVPTQKDSPQVTNVNTCDLVHLGEVVCHLGFVDMG